MKDKMYDFMVKVITILLSPYWITKGIIIGWKVGKRTETVEEFCDELKEELNKEINI